MIAPCGSHHVGACEIYTPHHKCTSDAHTDPQHRCPCGFGWRDRPKRINSQAKGKRFENRFCLYLIGHGWEDARRSVRAGFRTKTRTAQDEGDVTGTPGLCFQIKAGDTEFVPGVTLDRVWSETCEQASIGDRLPLLVQRRVGQESPANWHLWTLNTVHMTLAGLTPPPWTVTNYLVRCQLGDVINSLHTYSHHTERTS